MEEIRKLLDSKEVAEITGRSVRSVERDRESGDGCPYVRFGRLIRYRPEDVEKYIAAHLSGPYTAPFKQIKPAAVARKSCEGVT